MSGRPFQKGHPGGPGRPKRKTEEAYLRSLVSVVGQQDWKAIVQKAVAKAKQGDKDARKWLADYLMGQPVATQRNVNYTPEQYAAALREEWYEDDGHPQDGPESGGGSDTGPAPTS